MIKVKALANNAAEVMIYDPIGADWYGNGVTAKQFRDDLRALGNVSEIVVRINSPGGEVFDGFSIYNALKQHSARVVVHVDGLAASIASVIAMSGDEIHMGEGAMFMVHSPWTVAMGDAENMREVADMLDKISVGLVDAYVAKTAQPRDVVESWMAGETWFTRDEAIAAGLATHAGAASALPAAALSPLKIAASIQFREFTQRLSANAAKPSSPQTEKPQSVKTGASMEITMENENPSVQPTDTAAVLAAEQARRGDIRAAFGRFGDQHRVLLDKCLDDVRCSPEQARAELLKKLGEGTEPVATRIEVGADARDRFVAGASAALLARSGKAQREAGNEFNGMTLSDMATRALAIAGVSTAGLSRDGIARKVLSYHTSSDFPLLLSNTAGKVLRQAYEEYGSTWQKWCIAGEVSDFKIHPRIQMGAFNNLATIAEGGEYTYGSLSEEAENAQATTKGKAIALTRQMVVNDDLGGFVRRAMLMGRAAARSVNSDAYAYLTSGASNHGPTAADTGQWFNATAVSTAGGHANLTSSGTAISVTSLGVGRTAMRKQKDKSLQSTLNIEPKVLLVPVGKEDLAKEIVTSTTKDGQSNSNQPNVLRNAFEVISDPYLDGISATAWYLFASASDAAAPFEVVFLDGNQTPFIDETVDFDTDAMKFKVRLDYGIANGDWRGAYKNVGA